MPKRLIPVFSALISCLQVIKYYKFIIYFLLEAYKVIFFLQKEEIITAVS